MPRLANFLSVIEKTIEILLFLSPPPRLKGQIDSVFRSSGIPGTGLLILIIMTYIIHFLLYDVKEQEQNQGKLMVLD